MPARLRSRRWRAAEWLRALQPRSARGSTRRCRCRLRALFLTAIVVLLVLGAVSLLEAPRDHARSWLAVAVSALLSIVSAAASSIRRLPRMASRKALLHDVGAARAAGRSCCYGDVALPARRAKGGKATNGAGRKPGVDSRRAYRCCARRSRRGAPPARRRRALVVALPASRGQDVPHRAMVSCWCPIILSSVPFGRNAQGGLTPAADAGALTVIAADRADAGRSPRVARQRAARTGRRACAAIRWRRSGRQWRQARRRARRCPTTTSAGRELRRASSGSVRCDSAAQDDWRGAWRRALADGPMRRSRGGTGKVNDRCGAP